MTSVLILLSGFDPGTYYIEDDGDPTNGIAQLRGPDGSKIFFNIPTDFLTVTASAGRSVIFNLTESFGTADITVGSLTDSTQNPDAIAIANIRGAGDVVLASNGTITELGSDAAADIKASTLVLSAATGVGTAGNAIETQVGTLEAETTTGGINLGNIGNLTIGGLTDDVNGLDVDTSGNILLTNAGSIVVNEQSPGGFESIHGGSISGNVTLIANGASADITSTVDLDFISAAGGSVALTAGRDVSLGTGGVNFDNDVRARNSLTVNAGRDLNVDGFADLASDGFGAASGGNLTVNAGRDINVLNSTGTDASIGAEGSGGADVILNTGAGGFLRLLATSASSLFSSTGDVTVNADRVVISSVSGISASNGVVTLRPETDGWGIDLGSVADGAFALELSDAEADRIFAPTLAIGGSAAGSITGTAAFGPASVQNLILTSGSDISLQSALTVAQLLQLSAGENVLLAGSSATTAGALAAFVDQSPAVDGTGGLSIFDGALTAGTPTITGNGNADTLNGSSAGDIINGNAGNDTLNGAGGGDTLNGGLGDDTMAGGLGDDIFFVDSAGDTVSEALGEGNDQVLASVSYVLTPGAEVEQLATTNSAGIAALNLTGNEVANAVTGNAGNNILSGGGGSDTLTGLAGNDTLSGNQGNDILVGGNGNDTLDGGLDIDTASYVSAASGVTVDLRIGTAQNTVGAGNDTIANVENLSGSVYGDTLTGNSLDNVVTGLSGNDTLVGNFGNDTLSGNQGNDTLDGGVGDDTLDGGFDTDTATYASAAAGVAVDLRVVGAQNTLGAGNDTLTNIENLIGSAFADTLIGNSIDNILIGGAGNDILTGNSGNDTLGGNAGGDTLDGGLGNDTMDGGLDVDTALYSSALAGVTVDLRVSTAQNTVGAGIDTLLNIENLSGSTFNDALTGNSADNILSGLFGNDTLVGNFGNDTLGGNQGNDTLDGGAGNDLMDGGLDIDTASYGSAASGVTVDLRIAAAQNTVGAGNDTLANIENLSGSGFNDTLNGNSIGNVLTGLDGNDTLFGNFGNDTLNGGTGNDTLDGGAGADVFIFDSALSAATNVDTINNFAVVDDTIDLSKAIFSAAGGPGTLPGAAFFVGTAAHDADDRIIYDSATGHIFYDADGTGAAAQVLFAQVAGGLGLTNADFEIIA